MGSAILILLVEDEPLIGMAVADALEMAGYAVHNVACGDQAADFVASDAAKLCGLVTDIRIGDGPDGWEVARLAREACPHLPVVYMSGDSAGDHSARGVPDSVIIQKPFVPAQIVTAVSTLLNDLPPQPS